MITFLSKLTSVSYKYIARPVLFKFSSDTAHSLTTRAAMMTQAIPFATTIIKHVFAYEHSKLQQTVAGIQFDNPIGLSAGFDKEARLVKTMHAVGFGLEEVGSITAQVYDGNPKPWYTRLPHTESVLVNSGLRSSGVHAIADRADKMPRNTYAQMPINASIAKTNSPECNTVEKGIADYVASFKRLEKSLWPRLYTINISCPNTSGGEPFNDPVNLKKLLNAIDALSIKRPIFLKLPIDLEWKEIKPLLDVASKSTLTGVTIGNLAKDRSVIHPKDSRKLSEGQRGNLSGRPCWSPSNLLLAQCYSRYGDRFVFIGVGGVFSAEDAYTKIKLGASLVELITGMIYEGPSLMGEINKGITELMQDDGVEHISDVVGVEAKKYMKENT